MQAGRGKRPLKTGLRVARVVGKQQQLTPQAVNLSATPSVLGQLHRLKGFGDESQSAIHITGNSVRIRHPSQTIRHLVFGSGSAPGAQAGTQIGDPE